MSELAKSFLDYGAFGITTLVALLMTMRMYRDREVERKQNREEMHALEERYITKADTWMKQYYELQSRMTDLVETLSKAAGRNQ